MLFKILVETLYLTIVLQLFFIFLDLITPKPFGPEIYSLWGFFLFYFYTLLIMLVLRSSELLNNNKAKQ
ncbi:MAG: hypothetical protein NUV67_00875 [archaeon]|nr:hypothetical protein [archaeon]